MYYTAHYPSPVGRLTLASDGENLVGLWIEGQKYFVEQEGVPADLPVFRRTAAWLDRYFTGERPESRELPLAPAGSAFRQEVWRLLCEIPFGRTVTYGELARTLSEKQGRRTCARAVGGAVGHNPISIVIPCHRVLGSGGALTGYAGGLDKKIKLLKHENAAVGG